MITARKQYFSVHISDFLFFFFLNVKETGNNVSRVLNFGVNSMQVSIILFFVRLITFQHPLKVVVAGIFIMGVFNNFWHGPHMFQHYNFSDPDLQMFWQESTIFWHGFTYVLTVIHDFLTWTTYILTVVHKFSDINLQMFG